MSFYIRNQKKVDKRSLSFIKYPVGKSRIQYRVLDSFIDEREFNFWTGPGMAGHSQCYMWITYKT